MIFLAMALALPEASKAFADNPQRAHQALVLFVSSNGKANADHRMRCLIQTSYKECRVRKSNRRNAHIRGREAFRHALALDGLVFLPGQFHHSVPGNQS